MYFRHFVQHGVLRTLLGVSCVGGTFTSVRMVSSEILLVVYVRTDLHP